MNFEIENLPEDVFRVVFGFMKFKDVAESRSVSKRFKNVAAAILNSGLNIAVKQVGEEMNQVEGDIPINILHRTRHQKFMFRKCLQLTDIVEDLKHIYGPYIRKDLCPFIPGHVSQ